MELDSGTGVALASQSAGWFGSALILTLLVTLAEPLVAAVQTIVLELATLTLDGFVTYLGLVGPLIRYCAVPNHVAAVDAGIRTARSGVIAGLRYTLSSCWLSVTLCLPLLWQSTTAPSAGRCLVYPAECKSRPRLGSGVANPTARTDLRYQTHTLGGKLDADRAILVSFLGQ